MNIIIFGPQASGKGTQASQIAKYYDIPHISTGDIFRDNISKGTDLGQKVKTMLNKGTLIPNEVTNEIVKNRLEEDDCRDGFILDGYPRTRNQAEFLDSLPYEIDAVIDLQVSKELIIKRISSRRVCADCKTNYNILYLKPKREDECDKCQGHLVMREDDKPEAIHKRLKQYHEQTEPLLDFYKKKGILKIFNGEKPKEDVFEEIKKALE